MNKILIANAERLALEAMAAALEPPAPVDYLTWAENNIVFSDRESPLAGRYNRTLFRYLDEPLAALSPDDPCRIVTIKASAQIGKSTVALVFVCGSIAMDPRDVLVVHPNEENATRWSRLKLTPMLRGTSVLSRLFSENSRDGANAILFKERRDGLGAILISGANSPSALSQVSMSRQVQDDLSKWQVGEAGDPEQMADNRSRADAFAKLLKLSTPLISPGCKITRAFEAGSQEFPYVPCPHCAEMFVLTWENMLAHLDPAHPEAAHFVCEACGCEIRESDRPGLLAALEWRAKNPGAKSHHRSFHIWSAYSPLQSWELIAREWLKAKGDPASEQSFLNDTVGEAFRAEGAARAWEELRDRADASDYARGTIPPGALLLFMGIDCQGDRVEWQLLGWGRNWRRWVIDCGVIPGHIRDSDCQRKLEDLLARNWVHASGRRIGIDQAAIDANAFTSDVLLFARRFPISKLIMVRGRPDENAPLLALVRKEYNDRTGKLLKYSRRFYHIGVSVMKLNLYGDLAIEDPQAERYIAFPRGLDDSYFQQLTSERRVAINKAGTVFRWKKISEALDNEMLDTFNIATGAAIKFGVRGFGDVTWNRYAEERGSPFLAQGDLEDLLNKPKARPSLALKLAGMG
jgi:phage terminase large subunit GpA-like protein